MSLSTDDPGALQNTGRRVLLTSILAAYVSAFIPWRGVQAQTAMPAPVAASAAFLTVSQLLTGRASVEGEQANRLYAAFVALSPSFDQDLNALAQFIAQQKPAAHDLQAALDAAHVPYADLPRKLASAWYIGVVGTGKAARCETYETSLMYVVVADRVKPPSYAYGPYGSWGRNPLSA